MKTGIALFVGLLLTIGATFAGDTYKANPKESKVAWIAEKVTGSHNGDVKLKSGTLLVEKGQVTGGNFVINMTTINTMDLTGTWKDKLDGHLKNEDFFNVSKFPEATFKITAVQVLPKVSATGENIEVTGEMTIKGITQSITFNAKSTISTTKVTADATLKIDRTKFDIKYKSASFFDVGDKAIYDDFTIVLHLVADR